MPTLEEAIITVNQAIKENRDYVYKLEQDIGIANQTIIEKEATIAELESNIESLVKTVEAQQASILEKNNALSLLETDADLLEARIEVLKTMVIPTASSPWQIKKGDEGLRVWALQRALNSVGFDLLENAAFKSYMETQVKAWQDSQKILADGIFGIKSSAVLSEQICAAVLKEIPIGLVKGQVEAESANWIVAVNWSVEGGVDCGFTQRRVYSSDYSNQTIIRRAFDSFYQIHLLAQRLLERKNVYINKPLVSTNEFAWRLASLYHNWPYGADVLSNTQIKNLSSYWTTVKGPTEWPTNVGAKFPNGEKVDTPLKWAKFYALGAPDRGWPGLTTRFVESWEV